MARELKEGTFQTGNPNDPNKPAVKCSPGQGYRYCSVLRTPPPLNCSPYVRGGVFASLSPFRYHYCLHFRHLTVVRPCHCPLSLHLLVLGVFVLRNGQFFEQGKRVHPWWVLLMVRHSVSTKCICSLNKRLRKEHRSVIVGTPFRSVIASTGRHVHRSSSNEDICEDGVTKALQDVVVHVWVSQETMMWSTKTEIRSLCRKSSGNRLQQSADHGLKSSFQSKDGIVLLSLSALDVFLDTMMWSAKTEIMSLCRKSSADHGLKSSFQSRDGTALVSLSALDVFLVWLFMFGVVVHVWVSQDTMMWSAKTEIMSLCRKSSADHGLKSSFQSKDGIVLLSLSALDVFFVWLFMFGYPGTL
ncbi:hypothetical protein V8G54_018752 [Vigna mungo]|uniref:Uncharacterized protein n=1 Tax=Vigna mungo TaxID=3915 RepID=A0AAQ3NAS4_VIGMU